ncbi:MAG: hypothetical protein HQL17_03975 [Candidatus Omnitrophica bacterium]|nr:hypothetical protein [Candidatus Omnitrophota bacterium]
MTGTLLIYIQDEHTRDTLKGTLCNYIPLIVTEDTPQCLEALKQRSPVSKAIIGVSGMDDDDIADIIHSMLEIKPELKIIALGDKNSEDLAINAVRYGANGYILLPIKADELLATLR